MNKESEIEQAINKYLTIKKCDECGKDIVFGPSRPLYTYAYQLKMSETGAVHHKIFCCWSHYVKAKRKWCEERLSKMKQPKEYHSCEAWLDSMNPSKQGKDNYMIVEPTAKPRPKLMAKTSKKALIEKHYAQIKKRRGEGYSWKDIKEMLGNVVSADCIRRNYEIVERERNADIG